MACGGTARTGRHTPEAKASCLLWRGDPRLKPWGTQKQPQKAMAGTGKGNGRSRSLRDGKQKDKQRQNSKGWETMWWRNGVLRADGHKKLNNSRRRNWSHSWYSPGSRSVTCSMESGPMRAASGLAGDFECPPSLSMWPMESPDMECAWT